MLEDDGVTADERSAFAKAASVEPQIKPARTLSSHTKEEPKGLLDCVDALTALEPPTELLDPPASPDRALSQPLSEPVVQEDNHKVAPIAGPRSATSPPPSNLGPAYQHLKKRRNGRSKGSLVREGRGRVTNTKCAGRTTWLPRSELGNVQ